MTRRKQGDSVPPGADSNDRHLRPAFHPFDTPREPSDAKPALSPTLLRTSMIPVSLLSA